MLDSLHIQNYRLFKDLKIDKLGQVNLIAGKNNTGKTALLEALRIWDSKANINVLTNILFNRQEIINREPSNGYNLLRSTVDGIATIGDYKNNNYVRFAVDSNSKEKDKTVLLPFQNGITGDGNGYNIFKNIIYIPFSLEGESNPKLWEHTSLTPLENDVIDILKIVVPDIQRIGFTNNKFLILRSSFPFPSPIKKLGDGANRLFTIALALVNAKDKILLIDEFEVGLHHSVQEQLWDIIFKYAQEWNIQVFVTTHSQDTVEKFFYVTEKVENQGKGVFFTLNRDGENIVALDYDREEIKLALESNIEIR